ncbi:MAG: tRNA pseudouridine(38-40) synthase TruA [Clostridia bacterium]|nr:tRNA pseudouridine(38-40) synthase TruA [Clostridia bacterium]
MNYLLTICYDGANYCGYQIQPNLKTVQGVLEEALKQVFGVSVKTYASGRTDAGVSALGQTVNFVADKKFKEYSLLGYLNTILPSDVRVLSVKYVPDDFNARFSAKQKTYAYNFYLSRIDKPYLNKFATRVGYTLDMQKLESELKSLVGTFDFTSLSSTDTQVESKVRTISNVRLVKSGEVYTAYFIGNGFLKNMIRVIMGTAFDIARGKITESFLEIIEHKNRKFAGKTAGAVGLVLVEVNYS